MVNFTHAEVEAERRKPVGSLFMHIIDRDSVLPRPHIAHSARAKYNRSLENLELSKYKSKCNYAGKSKDKQLYAHDGTPLRGRRRLAQKSFTSPDKFNVSGERSHYVKRRSLSAGEHDHLGTNLVPLKNEPRVIRQRRFVASPGRYNRCSDMLTYSSNPLVSSHISQEVLPKHKSSANLHECQLISTNDVTKQENKEIDNINTCEHTNELQKLARSGSCNDGSLKDHNFISRRIPYYYKDHLEVSSLLPLKHSPKRRHFSPPLFITRPRHHGIKLFPPRRSLSVDDIKHGVRRVHPPRHERTVNDQQSDFLHVGVDCVSSSDKSLQRLHSTNSICSSNTNDANTSVTTTFTDVKNKQENAIYKPRWKGRSNSCKLIRRDFNIITNLPITQKEESEEGN